MSAFYIDGRRLTESERLQHLARTRNEDDLLLDDPPAADPIYWQQDTIRAYPPPVETMRPVDYADEEFDKMLQTQSLQAYKPVALPSWSWRGLAALALGGFVMAVIFYGLIYG